MPVYTYHCNNCGVRFDRMQSFADKPLTRCPECRKKKLRKVIAPVGIAFKGSGWYSTDHRSTAGRAAKSQNEDSGTKAENGSKAESAAESKPAKKAESKASASED